VHDDAPRAPAGVRGRIPLIVTKDLEGELSIQSPEGEVGMVPTGDTTFNGRLLDFGDEWWGFNKLTGVGPTGRYSSTVAVGSAVGPTGRYSSTVAVGSAVGPTGRYSSTVAVGSAVGPTGRYSSTVAVGSAVGPTGRCSSTVAVGSAVGPTGTEPTHHAYTLETCV
jgi:hypothetical protein